MVRYIIREKHPDRLVWVTIRKTLIWPVSVSSALCCDWSVSLPEQWAVLCGTTCSFLPCKVYSCQVPDFLIYFQFSPSSLKAPILCSHQNFPSIYEEKEKKRKKNLTLSKMLALFNARLGCNWALASSLCIIKSSEPAHLQCNRAKLKSRGPFQQSPPRPCTDDSIKTH